MWKKWRIHDVYPRSRKHRLTTKPDRDQYGAAAAGSGRSAAPLRRGGGWKKILAIIALGLLTILVAALVGGFLWWQSYKKSPAYTLALMVDAAQRDDTQAFDQIVDIDKITENFMPQVTERVVANSGLGAMLGSLRKQIDAAMPQLTAKAKESVREEIKRQTKELGARGANVPFFLLALAVPRMVDSITKENNTANVALKVGNRPIELTMQQANINGSERWRVTAVRDDELVARLAEGATKNLPSLGGTTSGATNRTGQNSRRGGKPNLPGNLSDVLGGGSNRNSSNANSGNANSSSNVNSGNAGSNVNANRNVNTVSNNNR